jgi:WD40 repeat protein
VQAAAFSPDAKRIVTASGDTARVWDAETGRLLVALSHDGAQIRSVAFSHDGQRIVTASTASSDQVAIWDAQSGQKLEVLAGHTGEVASAEFSPDDRVVVTASPDDFLAGVWDARTGKNLRMLRGHGGGVRRAAFDANGRRIVTVSDDMTAQIWDVDSGQVIAELPKLKKPIVSATFSRDGKHVAMASGNDALVWSVFSDTQALVDDAKDTAPRCLTPAQLPRAACPPAWCIERKWPYLHLGDEMRHWLAAGCRATPPTEATVGEPD